MPCAKVSRAARTSERPTACESVSTASVVVTVETSQTVVALAAPHIDTATVLTGTAGLAAVGFAVMAMTMLPGFAALGTARADAPQAVASFLALWEHAPVVHRILASLDLRDVRVLYDVARPLRYMIARPDVHERLLCRFLGPAGYVPWPDLDDPLPLTLHDCEAFHMYMYTEMELPVASHAYLTDMHRLDRRIPRLARSTARAYSRVLARIRLQPQGVPDVGAWGTIRGPDGTPHDVGMSSPFVPGYVSTFRAWVPCTADDDDGVWGAEIQRLERELFLAGMWRFLQRGDVVVNATNAHRFLFHGDAFAPLDTRFDAAGHLPPFINALLFPTTYYDWILPPTDTPTLFLDVLPWRADIISSLHLTRDHVEVVLDDDDRCAALGQSSQHLK